MSDVDVDPVALRRFAESLSHFTERVDQSFDAMRGRLAVLNETWDDEAFEDFSLAFTTTDRQLLEFIDVARRTLPKMLDHAERVEQTQQGVKFQ